MDCSSIHIGSCFSEPVFFDDGKNMFLAAGKQAKPYHVSALVHWKIPYLLTAGHPVDPKDFKSSESEHIHTESGGFYSDEIEELESLLFFPTAENRPEIAAKTVRRNIF